jgi:hypothetical protein
MPEVGVPGVQSLCLLNKIRKLHEFSFTSFRWKLLRGIHFIHYISLVTYSPIVSVTHQELDKIIKHKNIIKFIRTQRLGWLGHIERMQETRMVKAIYSWKPISRRSIGRPKIRWEDDVRKDVQKLKVPNWKTLVQDRRRWKELVEKAKTLHKEL